MVVATELAAPRAEPSLNALAAKATVNCLMGCAAGEITGMAIGTALGWSNVATLILAVGLAFLFGYALTSVPLVRSGLAVAAVVPIALAADTVSIAIMEAIDNAVVWAVPGAMDAGPDRRPLWGPLLGGFAVAFGPAFLVNRGEHPAGQGLLPRLSDAAGY